MARRIELLNQWRMWVNGIGKAFYNGLAAAIVASLGDSVGLFERSDIWKIVLSSVLARVAQYLLTHEPPDILVTETSTTAAGTVIETTASITTPKEGS